MSETQRYNRFTFCQDDYKKPGVHFNVFPDADEVDWDALWAAYTDFIRLAVKNGYQCHTWYDGYTLVVDYNYLDETISGVSLEWVGEDEKIVGSYVRRAENGAGEDGFEAALEYVRGKTDVT